MRRKKLADIHKIELEINKLKNEIKALDENSETNRKILLKYKLF
jgi:hypothetical protein